MTRYIVFDFDGTLADSREVFINVYNELAQKRNYRALEVGNLEELRSMPILERCRYLGVPVYRIPFMASEFLSLYRHRLHEIKLYEGIRQVLTAIRARGVEIAIISSNSVENISGFLVANGIDSISEIYSSRNLFGKHKVIQGFLKKHKLLPADILYCGDEIRDIEACKKVGVSIVAVDWGYDPREALVAAGPNYLISSPEELTTVVFG